MRLAHVKNQVEPTGDLNVEVPSSIIVESKDLAKKSPQMSHFETVRISNPHILVFVCDLN